MPTVVAPSDNENKMLKVNDSTSTLGPAVNAEHDWDAILGAATSSLAAGTQDAMKDIRKPHKSVGTIKIHWRDFIGHCA